MTQRIKQIINSLQTLRQQNFTQFRIIHRNTNQLIQLSGISRNNILHVNNKTNTQKQVLANNYLDNLLGSLIACQSLNAKIIAKESKKYIEEIIFVKVETYYEEGEDNNQIKQIKIEAIIKGNFSLQLLDLIKAKTQIRSPIHNMLIKAGVKIQSNWIMYQ